MVFVGYTMNHLHVHSNTSSGNRTNIYITVIVPLQDGWTAMIAACQKGHEHVVEALLKGGATVEIQDKVIPDIISPPPLCPYAYVRCVRNSELPCLNFQEPTYSVIAL